MLNRYDDRLDLLGVRYDAELELRAMHDEAEKIIEKNRQYITDYDLFKKECMKDIRNIFSYESDVETVWRMIKEDTGVVE